MRTTAAVVLCALMMIVAGPVSADDSNDYVYGVPLWKPGAKPTYAPFPLLRTVPPASFPIPTAEPTKEAAPVERSLELPRPVIINRPGRMPMDCLELPTPGPVKVLDCM